MDPSRWPRINEIFGPTKHDYYWTNDTVTPAEFPDYARNLAPHSAWAVNFGRVDASRNAPEVQSGNKVAESPVRAVRRA